MVISKCRKCNNTASKTSRHIDCWTTVYGIKCDSYPSDCTNSIMGEKTEEEAIIYWNDHQ